MDCHGHMTSRTCTHTHSQGDSIILIIEHIANTKMVNMTEGVLQSNNALTYWEILQNTTNTQ